MGDYLSTYDGPSLKSSPAISRWGYESGYKEKSYSSSGPYMLVQFVTDHENKYFGFRAKIHYIPIDPICKDWLNINSGFLTSPEYPTQDCSFVITSSMGSIISIQFQTFEVK